MMKRTDDAKAKSRAVRDANRAMDGLRRIVRALRVGNARAETSHGISSAQLFALRAIAATPGGSMSDLASSTLTSQSTVSEVVARLLKQGLVTRSPSADDRRRMELGVSEKGKMLLHTAPATVQEQLAAGFLSLPQAQQKALAEGLSEWIDASGLAEIPAAMFFEDRQA